MPEQANSEKATNQYTCMSQDRMIEIIADDLELRVNQVKSTVELLDQDNTIPFIARYRKEVTGKLDEEQIRNVQTHIKYLRNLEERKQTVLKTIAEQEKLTDELRSRICQTRKLQEVEDLYLPYKPKRKTRGTVAKARGLEPLAMLIWQQETLDGTPEELAQPFVDAEKEIPTVADALQGACDIVAEMVSDRADIRQFTREYTTRNGVVESEAKDKESRSDFEM